MEISRVFFKLFCAAAALIFAIFSSLSAFAAEITPYVTVSAPPKIVFVGDSIAAGYGLDGYSPDDKGNCASYANILSLVFEKNLPAQAHFTHENVAVDGLTSSKLLSRLSDGEFDEALENADAVVLSIGGNDLLSVFFKLVNKDSSFSEIIDRLATLDSSLDERLDRFETNLPQIVDMIRSLAPDSRIFIQTLYNPFDGYKISALDELAQDKIGRLNEIICADSEDGKNYIVADVAAAFEGKAQELTNISDLDIHPNADGHAQIAKVLEPLIEEKEYTYFDENAQQAYLEEQNDREKSKKQRAAVFVAGAAAVAVTAAAAVLGRKKRSAKQSDERNEL